MTRYFRLSALTMSCAASDGNGHGQDVRLGVRQKRLALWSPEKPGLARRSRLKRRVSETADRPHRPAHLLSTEGKELLFNGKPIFLRGISIHEEPIGPTRHAPDDRGRCAALACSEAKALGCNFVRLAHYPHSEVTLRLADEMGLIVWSEIPVYWEDIFVMTARAHAGTGAVDAGGYDPARPQPLFDRAVVGGQ